MSAKAKLGFGFGTKTIKIGNRDWTFRELSVEENDECSDAAQLPDGKWSGRIAMRAMILRSAVDPKLTPDEIAALPISAYNAIVEAVNTVNSGDITVEGDDPNA